MSVIERRKRLLRNIALLRRAERAAPGNPDIVAVRTALEEELGGTVSRRLAADFLGVSHAALARWIKAGDLALVHDAEGRPRVPVTELLSLHDAVTEERNSGRRRRRVLEPVMTEGRRRAEQTNFSELAPADARPGETPGGHRRAERRSLAYHRAVARRLRRPMLDEALHRVWQWRDQGRIDPRYADEWEAVLRKPVNEVRRIISADDPTARDLRQNSPFAGMLSEAERRKMLAEVR